MPTAGKRTKIQVVLSHLSLFFQHFQLLEICICYEALFVCHNR